jgi:RHS repeat-associated protein
VETETAVDNKWLKKTYSYAGGNVASVQYNTPAGTLATERYLYTYGHLTEIQMGYASIWKLTDQNAFGQATSSTTGGISRSYAHSAYGLPAGRSAQYGNTTVQNFTYSFDTAKGNLTNRKDNTRGIQENFTYDNLNRLTGYAGKTAAFDAKGNITQKSDVGPTFHYNIAGKPYAISGVTTSGNTAIPLRNQTITYTSFSRPQTISENNYTASFVYNGAGGRVRMELKQGTAVQLKRYYIGGRYEADVTSSASTSMEKLYLGGDAYTAPAVYVKQGTGAWQLYYIFRDYLGSITHVTNSSGALIQELSYDAWGRLRAPVNQTAYTPGTEPTPFLGRGYTGHEHLPWFGLVNMNARLYDPATGRFLSPDPYVQMPDFSQNFNRYTYCLNNPLRYTDPDGEIVWAVPVIIGAIVGAYTGGVIANNGQYNPAKWDYSSGKTWGYMLGGALVGGVSGYAGWSIAGSGIPMANTASMAGSSLINSVGTWAYTGGQTPISMSIGVASYDFTNGSFGYLGKKGNKWYENVGYGLGTLTNLKDINDIINSTTAHLYTQTKDSDGSFDVISHSGIKSTNGGVMMSYGPNSEAKLPGYIGFAVEPKLSTPDYTILRSLSLKSDEFTVNKYLFTGLKAVSKFTLYQGATSNCVNWSSLGLWLNGIPNVGVHPFLLHGSMAIYNTGIYNVLARQIPYYLRY